MSIFEKVKASPEFVQNFKAVAAHYGCTPSEIEEMTICARADMAAAGECFAAIAKEIAA
jgi:RecA-family ATPase